jgi:hypothetical protein
MFEHHSVDDLCRLAAHGAGFELKAAQYTAADLSRIAANAAAGGGRLVIVNVNHFSVDELCRIAANGKGQVEFR